ncbi:TetR/AcrR family transcriptional regulator [Rhizobium herbae]|uniref:AcrR family transcriptional regulator n=1 Tax=Rhizobium herbae TaxID=508661 RepID=A0ABS4EGA9_9HYPH|nr:TetR/AcrR family transcriptional regulator [Rhizobium herbae]MBP1856881.1 AcrR family transcriptional regulator [Rhizobium herbae]
MTDHPDDDATSGNTPVAKRKKTNAARARRKSAALPIEGTPLKRRKPRLPVSRQSKPAGKSRDAIATRAQILEVATAEFAAKGLGGARVDTIAERAGFNKRMLYHYFESKENLFQAVIETAYMKIWQAEATLELNHMPPEQALRRLVVFTWDYYIAHPEFITLLNSENLHQAKHFKRSQIIQDQARQSRDLVRQILDRGVEEGIFRSGIDSIQLNITISALGYYYLTNHHTASVVYERNMASPEALADRLEFNIQSILAIVRV